MTICVARTDSGLLPSPAQPGLGASTASVEKCPFGAPWRQSPELWGAALVRELVPLTTSRLDRAFRKPGVRSPGALAVRGASLSGVRKSQPLPSGSPSLGEAYSLPGGEGDPAPTLGHFLISKTKQTQHRLTGTHALPRFHTLDLGPPKPL